jgi:hypothetical protein
MGLQRDEASFLLTPENLVMRYTADKLENVRSDPGGLGFHRSRYERCMEVIAKRASETFYCGPKPYSSQHSKEKVICEDIYLPYKGLYDWWPLEVAGYIGTGIGCFKIL